MFTYIELNGSIIQMDEKPTIENGYEFSEKIEDLYKKRIALTNEQSAFYEANKTASAREIFAMQVNEQVAIELSPAEQRKQAYATRPIVAWEGQLLAVDEANALYLFYFAEGDLATSEQLKELIKEAKTAIREEIA